MIHRASSDSSRVATRETRQGVSNGRLLAIAAALLVGLTVLSRGGYPFDLACWTRWSKAIFENGLAHAYALPDCNYPPGCLLLLGGVAAALHGDVGSPLAVKAFKLVWIAFDVAAIGLVMRLLRDRGRNPYLALWLVNPAFLLDSVFWGQCDGSIALFAIASGYAALCRRPALAAFLVSCGLAVKMQEIVFVPFVVFLAWPSVRGDLRRFAAALGAGLAPWIVLAFPFVRAGTLGAMVHNLSGNGSMYPFVSMHAFNPWYIFGGDATSDAIRFAGLSLKAWGLLGFGAAFVTACVLLGPGSSAEEGAPSDDRIVRAATAGGLVAMAFFLFNTEMHERYLHPAMLFFAVAAFLGGRVRAFVAVSVAVFVNESLFYAKGASDRFDVHALGTGVAILLLVVFALEMRWLGAGRSRAVRITG